MPISYMNYEYLMKNVEKNVNSNLFIHEIPDSIEKGIIKLISMFR